MDLLISIQLCALYPALDWALIPSAVTLAEFDVAIQKWWCFFNSQSLNP